MSCWRWCPLVLLLVLMTAGCSAGKGGMATIFYRNQAAFERAAEQVLEQRDTDGVDLPQGVLELCYYDSPDRVEFSMGGSGFGSSTAYWGVVYTTGDVPVGFQGTMFDGTWDGEGWHWEEPEGDNWSYITQLDEHWYAYEMHF